ncbi:hypothetical protein E2P81_ATG06292 [Venturia nashicola]|nr:hypothetical protein E2P81_ATG06292 [Venturia nashicola]
MLRNRKKGSNDGVAVRIMFLQSLAMLCKASGRTGSFRPLHAVSPKVWLESAGPPAFGLFVQDMSRECGPDGCLVECGPDGCLVECGPDGCLVECGPDGCLVECGPDGCVVECGPGAIVDGKLVLNILEHVTTPVKFPCARNSESFLFAPGK